MHIVKCIGISSTTKKLSKEVFRVSFEITQRVEIKLFKFFTRN